MERRKGLTWSVYCTVKKATRMNRYCLQWEEMRQDHVGLAEPAPRARLFRLGAVWAVARF